MTWLTLLHQAFELRWFALLMMIVVVKSFGRKVERWVWNVWSASGQKLKVEFVVLWKLYLMFNFKISGDGGSENNSEKLNRNVVLHLHKTFIYDLVRIFWRNILEEIFSISLSWFYCFQVFIQIDKFSFNEVCLKYS